MGKPLQRIKEAFSKAFFCARHTADAASFLRLVRETKKWKHFMQNPSAPVQNDKFVAYQLRLLHQNVTLHLRTFRGDLQIFYEVFWREVYPASSLQLQQCKTIVDVGGHVGMSALYFGLQAPNATIYVLEPDRNNFGLLRQNTSVLHNRIISINAAVAADRTALFLQESRYSYNSKTSAETGAQPVFALGMGDLVQQYNFQQIDLMKIDIEGAEEALFSENVKWLSITTQIIIEIHSASAFAVFEKAVASVGFVIHCLSGAFGDAGIYHAMKEG